MILSWNNGHISQDSTWLTYKLVRKRRDFANLGYVKPVTITPLSAPFLCWDIHSQSYFLCSYHSPLFSPGEGVPSSAISFLLPRFSLKTPRSCKRPSMTITDFFGGGGAGISTLPRPLAAGPCPAGRLDRKGGDRGRPSPLASAAAQRPGNRRDALPVPGFSPPFSFSPVFPLFHSPTVFLSSILWWREKTAQSCLLPINTRVLFPNLSRPPLSP